ncbi:hypothetical protein [Bailinhaonella thermotolerans]|uniref:hypothetical protein n=1 Tax=Bailinhaonella thermotolerans TaxID=1070861 RepID=UPI0011C48815|nr:hypothetical protein [Bailinhaonella thermotolerans]
MGLYRPIGFHGTLSFLRSRCGPLETDEAALLRAIAVLEESRDLWLADLRAYAGERAGAKRRGRRSPASPAPGASAHWYGLRQEAAPHGVLFWHRRLWQRRRRRPTFIAAPAEAVNVLRACAEAVLSTGGHLPPDLRGSLAASIVLLRADPEERGRADFGAGELLALAREIEAASSP